MRKVFLILSFVLVAAGNKIMAQQDSVWTLEKCINYAYEKNITVLQGELTNQQNALNANQAKLNRLMSINASVGENLGWSKNSTTSVWTGSNGSSYGVNSGITVFNGSNLTNHIIQAELAIDGGNYSLETTKESISLSILNAYLQILYAEEQVKNAEKQIESIQSQLTLAKERLATQLIAQSDYAQVKSQMASEVLTLATSKNTLAIDKINLMQLMELPVVDTFNIAHPDLSGQIDQKRMPDVKAVYAKALEIKPQIKNAAVNKNIAALNEKIAKSNYYPVLSASAEVATSYSSNYKGDYFNQIKNGIYPALGLSLAIPIYQKSQARLAVQTAAISYHNSELSELNTQYQLRQSIEQACQNVVSGQTQYEASLENYNAMLESAQLAEEKFTQGVINSTDYLVAKTNLIVAESQLLQAKFNLIFCYKILDFYTGVPLTI
ncbi:MAG: TolC family protein [Bacteroidales bacterium]|jgi:outer membrane protein